MLPCGCLLQLQPDCGDVFSVERKLQTVPQLRVFVVLLPPASEGWGKVIISVCLSVHTWGGTPVPGSFPGLWSQILSGGYTQPGLEYPPPPRTGYAAGSMPHAVSCRRISCSNEGRESETITFFDKLFVNSLLCTASPARYNSGLEINQLARVVVAI